MTAEISDSDVHGIDLSGGAARGAAKTAGRVRYLSHYRPLVTGSGEHPLRQTYDLAVDAGGYDTRGDRRAVAVVAFTAQPSGSFFRKRAVSSFQVNMGNFFALVHLKTRDRVLEGKRAGRWLVLLLLFAFKHLPCVRCWIIPLCYTPHRTKKGAQI